MLEQPRWCPRRKSHAHAAAAAAPPACAQHCWRMPAGGAFLHSPLLDELKAIQDVLDLSRQQQEDLQLVEVADTSAKAKSQARQLARAGAAAAGATGAAAAAPPALQGPEDSAGDGGAGCTPDLPRLALRRDSCGASSSGAGAGASAAGLDRQGSAALAAILESPTCMLSSSDFEWEGGSARWAREARPPSLDLSPLRDGGAAAAAAPGGSSLFHPDDAADAPASPGGSLFQGKELECCICLETLYKPVGLACGHKVRARAPLRGSAAGGRGCSVGCRACGRRAARDWPARPAGEAAGASPSARGELGCRPRAHLLTSPAASHPPRRAARPPARPAVLQAVRPRARGPGARGGHVCQPLLLCAPRRGVPAVPPALGVRPRAAHAPAGPGAESQVRSACTGSRRW